MCTRQDGCRKARHGFWQHVVWNVYPSAAPCSEQGLNARSSPCTGLMTEKLLVLLWDSETNFPWEFKQSWEKRAKPLDLKFSRSETRNSVHSPLPSVWCLLVVKWVIMLLVTGDFADYWLVVFGCSNKGFTILILCVFIWQWSIGWYYIQFWSQVLSWLCTIQHQRTFSSNLAGKNKKKTNKKTRKTKLNKPYWKSSE